jgi:hypothetical protein
MNSPRDAIEEGLACGSALASDSKPASRPADYNPGPGAPLWEAM